MNQKIKTSLYLGILFVSCFLSLTLIISLIDVQTIGPNNSAIGLATINNYFHKLIGTDLTWYHLTDMLALVPLLMPLIFTGVGLFQLIKRKSLLKIDTNLLNLGITYLIIVSIYLFFENFIINYRPVLLDNTLDASYPSSHCLLAITLLGTAIVQLPYFIKDQRLSSILKTIALIFIVIIVLGRLISGVHWFTDIVAGILLGLGIVFLHRTIVLQHKVEKR